MSSIFQKTNAKIWWILALDSKKWSNQKDEVDFSAKELITSLRKKFVEVVECQFLCRVPSPYVDNPEEPDPQIKTFPKLTMTPALMFIVPEINFKVCGYF